MPFLCLFVAIPIAFSKPFVLPARRMISGGWNGRARRGLVCRDCEKVGFWIFFCFILCRLQFFVVTLQTEMKIAKSYIPYGGLFGESRGGEAQRYKYNTARPPGTLSERSGERRNWTACMASTSWTTVPAGWTVPRDVSPPRVLWHMITARGVPTYTAMIIQWTE